MGMWSIPSLEVRSAPSNGSSFCKTIDLKWDLASKINDICIHNATKLDAQWSKTRA